MAASTAAKNAAEAATNAIGSIPSYKSVTFSVAG